MSSENFYLSQSQMTDPGKYGYLYDDLPDDISELCRITQNLILHYADQEIFDYTIPKHRFIEMDDRFVETILSRAVMRNPESLRVERTLDEKSLGVCRDNSILLCSILRHKNIPARLRSGFATYFIPKFCLDSVAVEYWNKSKNKWCLVDARTSPFYIKKLKIDFDLTDLEDDKFIPAETAWNLCRLGLIKSNHFGSRNHRGLWYVRNRFIHEIAFINKYEMLIWDIWGYMLDRKGRRYYISEEQFAIFDKLELLLKDKNNNLIKLCDFYQHNKHFKIPKAVSVFNPMMERRLDHVELK